MKKRAFSQTKMASHFGRMGVTRTKRQKMEPAKDLGYQMVVKKFKYGRNMTQLEMLRRLDACNRNYCITRFGRLARCTSAQAAFNLMLFYNGTTWNFPLHVIELTQKPMVFATGAAIANAPISSRPTLNVLGMDNAATDVLQWTSYQQQTTDGVGTSAYYQQMGNPSFTVSSTEPLCAASRAYLEWSKVKFCFRTPAQRAGRIVVQLVEIDEKFCPGEQLNVADNAEVTNFWQDQLTGYLYNPIKTSVYRQKIKRQPVKVLRQWIKTFEPAQTIEGDTTPNHVRLEFFLRLNKFVSFEKRSPSGDAGTETAAEVAYAEEFDRVGGIAAPTTVEDGSNAANWPLDGRYRRFIIVKGTNYDAETATFSTNTHISYDVDIQNKWVFRPSTFK